MSYSSVLVTFPDLQTAKKIATAAVDQRLAACANLLPVESIYRWQDEVVDEQETAALFKIRSADFPLFRQFISEHHPYEVPCIVRYEIAEGNVDYLNWIKETTQRESAQ